MKKNLYEVIPVPFVERSSRLNGTLKKFLTKKALILYKQIFLSYFCFGNFCSGKKKIVVTLSCY